MEGNLKMHCQLRRYRRNYKHNEENIIVKANYEPEKGICLEIESPKDKFVTLHLSKSEATAITQSLIAVSKGDCSATIKPIY